MRIFLPTHQRFHGGGIARVVEGLERILPTVLEPGDELVVPSAPRARFADELRGFGGSRGALARLAYEQVALPRTARRADTLHLCDARPIAGARRPFVVQIHDVAYLDHPAWFTPGSRRYKATMLRAALALRPAAVVCDSAFTRERLLAHHPEVERRSRVVVIAPGVDPPPPAPPVEPPGPDDVPYVLTVSTIEPRKNHLGFAEAFRHALRAGLRMRWKVVGATGHQGTDIVRRLTSMEGVDVLGFVAPDALERLWAGATFAAVPSLVEGFGYPPLEAMARGVPVAYATGSAMDETVGDAGLPIPAEDRAAWTAGLLQLAGDAGQRAALAARGRARVPELGWERAARQIYSLHRSIA